MNRPDFGVRSTVGLDDVIPREAVMAVEVYWGPFQAPIKYQGTTKDNACGVVLFWTTAR